MLVARREENYYYKNRDKRLKEKKKKKNNKNNSNEKLKFIICAIIILLACLFVLLRYARITQIRLEMTKLEDEKIKLEKEKQDLIVELDKVKNASKIEEDAKVKLGMDYPTNEQIIYVFINDETVEEKELAKETKEKEENSIGKYLKSMVDVILK